MNVFSVCLISPVVHLQVQLLEFYVFDRVFTPHQTEASKMPNKKAHKVSLYLISAPGKCSLYVMNYYTRVKTHSLTCTAEQQEISCPFHTGLYLY